MDWYYARGQEQRGPVSAEQLQALIASGEVTPDTLVWNQTLPNWQPLRETALAPTPGAAATAQPRCIITGKTFPPSQMIQTEHGWVSAEGRDTYYQCLREGVPFPVPPEGTNARADGKNLVVPVGKAVLPRRCVKTNQPVTEADVKHKVLYWCTPWIYLALLLNLLVVLILYLVLRKKVPIDIPLSREGRRQLRKHALISGAIAVIGLVAVFVAVANPNLILLLPLGIVLVLTGCIYANFKATLLRPVKMRDGHVWLAGACPEYLALLTAR